MKYCVPNENILSSSIPWLPGHVVSKGGFRFRVEIKDSSGVNVEIRGVVVEKNPHMDFSYPAINSSYYRALSDGARYERQLLGTSLYWVAVQGEPYILVIDSHRDGQRNDERSKVMAVCDAIGSGYGARDVSLGSACRRELDSGDISIKYDFPSGLVSKMLEMDRTVIRMVSSWKK